jgi:glycosyltransferase involved in cell wall biosynthesis
MISTNEIPEQVVGLFDGDTDPRPVMVTIRCVTYNHEAYIRQALEGFVMQKTNFRFEAIVHDDASTDGTAAIIREYAEKYPDIIKPIYETENQYSKHDGSLSRIMNAASRGKYIAMCEGDDYWIDPFKLQKQVDYMEQHSDTTVCFHAVKEIYEGRPHLNRIRAKIENREYTGLEWYRNRPSQTSSYFITAKVFKMPFMKEVMNNQEFLVGDQVVILGAAHYGKIYGMSDVMSVYRHNQGGWTAQKWSDAEILKIANSHLLYQMFGDEYVSAGIYFYQQGCVSAFLYGLKDKKFKYKFLMMSLRKSVKGTIKVLIDILNSKRPILASCIRRK